MIKLYGGSHQPKVEGILSGFPADFRVDMDYINSFLQLRRGGQEYSTPRKETDEPIIVSGIEDNYTTGGDIIVEFANENTVSRDYEKVSKVFRPSHTEYVAQEKFGSDVDLRGGGAFSARLTAPVVFFGGLCHQYLAKKGIKIASHILQIDGSLDKAFSPTNVKGELLDKLNTMPFATIDEMAKADMLDTIKRAKEDLDSVGGIIESAVINLPVGTGDIHFGSLEGTISKYLFGIPAVKGVSFGKGFDFATMYGSEANDCYAYKDGKVVTLTNNNGGILGGLANGMPVLINTVFKPTPSIAKEQFTLNFETKEMESLIIKGRHDPCVLPRANIIVTSAIAVAVAEVVSKEDECEIYY